MLSVYIVDDHPLVAEGLTKNLKKTPVACSLSVFYNAEDALMAAKDNKPDMIVSDISLPGMNGMEMVAKLKGINPKIRILFFSMHQQAWRIREIIKLNAHGMVFKTATSDELMLAFCEIADGRTYFGAEVKEIILSLALENHSIQLTKREKQVLGLIHKGLTAKQMAEILNVSTNTIDSFKKTLFVKFKVKSSTAVISQSKELGYYDA